MIDREKGALDFLARVDASASMHALHQDASNRRYYRLIGAKRPSLLMDSPPGLENLSQFVKVATFLSATGLGVPTIYETAMTPLQKTCTAWQWILWFVCTKRRRPFQKAFRIIWLIKWRRLRV